MEINSTEKYLLWGHQELIVDNKVSSASAKCGPCLHSFS